MSRAEDAVIRLYEESALRGELTDAPADRLLKWAEDQLMALDGTAADDAAFEAGESALHAQLKQVNRVVGTTLSANGVMPDAVAADFGAQSASPLSAETVQAAATPDEMALVENLIALISADSPAPIAIPPAADSAEQALTVETAIAEEAETATDAVVEAADETATDVSAKFAKLSAMIRDVASPKPDTHPPTDETQGDSADE